MKVWALWHGGFSYAHGDSDDVEEFDSIKDASHELRRRESGADSFYPCVEESSMVLFDYDPRPLASVSGDWYYPFCSIALGPRGGIVRKDRNK